ncbi:MAG: aspartate kinase [Lachnospiraceae bacterium]|nr:aspartate kinase [Lachnospiraceae bacterium]
MLIVKKFGGTSVADKERIFNVARRAAEDYRNGDDVILVLSAQGDTTDDLIAKAHEITNRPSKRELDMLMTVGEQISVSLMAMALQDMGIPAVSLNAWQVPMHTSRTYGGARIKSIDSERIMTELDHRRVVVITGFQGVNRYDDYTTLGRGGSDTTAVAIAAALKADKCEIFTDVDGVYTADPRIVKNARKLSEITYDEMLELASLGAQVLNNRSVELAKKFKVKLVVRSSLNDSEGTIVKGGVKVEKLYVSGVACDKKAARISVLELEDIPGVAFNLFNMLAKHNINVDVIIQSVGRDGTKDITFTVNENDLEDAVSILEEHQEELLFKSISVNKDIAKVSIVGNGMMSHSGVAAKMFEALYDAHINIGMISTSEIKVSVLIDQKHAEKAMNAIHDKFGLEG